MYDLEKSAKMIVSNDFILNFMQHGLRTAAYEALMELVKNSAKDCYGTVQQTTLVILSRLLATIGIESGASSLGDKQHVQDVQSLLCAGLQVLKFIHSLFCPFNI
jgi:hypothetical protein